MVPGSLRTAEFWTSLLVLGLGVLIHVWWWPLLTVDMGEFLLPWLAHIRATGPVAAFATPFSNYMPPYLYLLAAASPLAAWMPDASVIKLVSMLGTLMLTLAARHLLLRLGVPSPGRKALVVALLPSVVINAGLMGQCDAWWAAPLVMATAAAIDRRHAAMFAWCGLAFAIKAQAAFAAPFFLALVLARRVQLRLWALAPLTAIAALLPAVAMGWPPRDLAMVYFRQAGHNDGLAFNAPNLWSIVEPLLSPSLVHPLTWLAFAAAVGATLLYLVLLTPRLARAGADVLLAAAALAPLIVCGLLPRMHERFFFFADVIAILLALARPDARAAALLVQAGSALALFAYLSGFQGAAALGAVATIAGTFLLAGLVRGGKSNARTQAQGHAGNVVSQISKVSA